MTYPTSTNYRLAVLEFMRKHGQFTQDYPNLVPEDLADFRIRLIEEELQEFRTAILENNIYGISDALADILYVVFGAAVTYGLPIDSIFEEVHRSNMTKEKIRVEGNEHKVGKGASYSPPRLRILIDQCIRMRENK